MVQGPDVCDLDGLLIYCRWRTRCLDCSGAGITGYLVPSYLTSPKAGVNPVEHVGRRLDIII